MLKTPHFQLASQTLFNAAKHRKNLDHSKGLTPF